MRLCICAMAVPLGGAIGGAVSLMIFISARVRSPEAVPKALLRIARALRIAWPSGVCEPTYETARSSPLMCGVIWITPRICKPWESGAIVAGAVDPGGTIGGLAPAIGAGEGCMPSGTRGLLEHDGQDLWIVDRDHVEGL